MNYIRKVYWAQNLRNIPWKYRIIALNAKIISILRFYSTGLKNIINKKEID
jgi:hypothetical protein